MADLITANYGTIITIDAQSRRGRRWLRQNVDAAGLRSRLETGCDCDHRYGIEIVRAAVDAGLDVEDGASGRKAVARG